MHAISGYSYCDQARRMGLGRALNLCVRDLLSAHTHFINDATQLSVAIIVEHQCAEWIHHEMARLWARPWPQSSLICR